jgi:hypothetical protein
MHGMSGRFPYFTTVLGFAGPHDPDGRQCSRSDCSQPATSTLTYQYHRSQVWLDDLSGERDPHGYDLCESHAVAMSVPRGWWLDDRRSAPHNADSLIA